MQAEIDEAASPKLIPGSLGIGNSGTKLSEKSRHEEPFGVSRMRNHAGQKPGCPEHAWRKSRRAIGERPTVMLGERKLICNPGGLQDWRPSVAKAAGQTGQPRDYRNTGRRKFLGSSVALSQTREGER